MRRADRRTRRRGRELPDAEQPADGVQRGGDVPWLRVAVAGLLGLLLALRRVPVVARALTAPGMVNARSLRTRSGWPGSAIASSAISSVSGRVRYEGPAEVISSLVCGHLTERPEARADFF